MNENFKDFPLRSGVGIIVLNKKNKLYELKLLVDTAIKQIENQIGKPFKLPMKPEQKS